MKLYFSTLYLAVTLLLVGGCAKKTEEPIPAPNILPKPVVDIQQSQKLFLANGYDKKLTELVLNADHTKSTQSLTPLWDKARQRDTPPAAACAYIPLAHTVTMIGAQDYLLVAKTAKGLDFSVASYLYDPSKVNQLSPNDPSFFTTFTGTVLIKSLATGEITRATYQNGTLTPSVTLPTKGTNPNTLGQNVCDYFTTCYYSGYQEFSTVTVGYVSTSRGSTCLPPGFGAPTGFYSSIAWTLMSSSTNYQCEYVDVNGPNPLPPPPPPSTGSSGSNANFDNTINDTALKPCMTAVLDGIRGLSSGRIADIIHKFAGQTPGYNWNVQNGTLPTGTNGATNNYDRSTNSVTTTFDAGQFGQATDLSIARTIMHESVHAYLGAFFADDPNLAGAAYSDMVMAYATHVNATANDLQHDEMVRGWVQDIADALQQYGISKGYNLPSNFYSSLAWGGLEGTRAFKNLPSANQISIHDTILTELTGKDSSGTTQTPSGTLAGCP